MLSYVYELANRLELWLCDLWTGDKATRSQTPMTVPRDTISVDVIYSHNMFSRVYVRRPQWGAGVHSFQEVMQVLCLESGRQTRRFSVNNVAVFWVNLMKVRFKNKNQTSNGWAYAAENIQKVFHIAKLLCFDSCLHRNLSDLEVRFKKIRYGDTLSW